MKWFCASDFPSDTLIKAGRLFVLANVIFIFTSASVDDQHKQEGAIIYESKLFILGVLSIFDQTIYMPCEMLINVLKLLQIIP